MKTRLTLRPGDKGTKALVARYGERLIAVRYRYDSVAQRRIKTAEIIVADAPWTPETVHVRIDYTETDLRRAAKWAGGRWDARLKLWELPADAARRLGLAERIVRQGC